MLQQANELADHFAALPREQAIKAIHDHIRRFWDPPTRDRLIHHVAHGAPGLHPLVIEAVKRMEVNA